MGTYLLRVRRNLDVASGESLAAYRFHDPQPINNQCIAWWSVDTVQEGIERGDH